MYIHARQFPHLAGMTEDQIVSVVKRAYAKYPRYVWVMRAYGLGGAILPISLLMAAGLTALHAMEIGLPVGPAIPRACDNMDTAHLRGDAAQSAICHLYVMAEVDERAGEYARADQWRALARELKSASHCIETATLPLGDSSPGSSPSPDLAR